MSPRPAPTVTVPPWLLVPGVALLVASAACYVQLVQAHHAVVLGGLDLAVYQGGGEAWRHGEAVYDRTYTHADLGFTYPPVTLLPFAVLSLIPHAAAIKLTAVAIAVAAGLTAFLVTGMLGYRGPAGRLGLTAGAAGVAIWLEPVHLSMNLGQINAFLMLLVVADFVLIGRTRWGGVGIGLATAAKLVPGLFVVYLLLTRRFRAAVIAGIAFVAATALGWIADPDGSNDFWIGGLFYRDDRVTSAVSTEYIYNQSLHGLSARLLPAGIAGAAWVVLAVLAAAGGLALAVYGFRRDGEPLGMLVCAFTALLVSPIAWTHHWVWIVPALVYTADLTRRASGRLRTAVVVLPTGLLLAFLAWPLRAFTGSPLVPRGVLLYGPDLDIERPAHRTFAEALTGETYTLAALGTFALAAVCLWRTRRSIAADELSGETPGTSPNHD
jgi:alpha-1,2-mannosyltransferase